MPLRRFQRHQRWSLPLAVLLLLFGQLAFATHSLHLKASPSDTACSFCMAGSHLGTAPKVAIIAAPTQFAIPIASCVADVCESLFLVSPRLSRGPPLV